MRCRRCRCDFGRSRRLGYGLARLVIMGCRSVHEMIWTILLVAILGFGMLPGTLALTL